MSEKSHHPEALEEGKTAGVAGFGGQMKERKVKYESEPPPGDPCRKIHRRRKAPPVPEAADSGIDEE